MVEASFEVAAARAESQNVWPTSGFSVQQMFVARDARYSLFVGAIALSFHVLCAHGLILLSHPAVAFYAKTESLGLIGTVATSKKSPTSQSALNQRPQAIKLHDVC